MNEEKGYVDLLQRVTDIYSGALGQEWNDDEHIIGAEELAVIIPAVLDRLFPGRPEWFRKPGFFMRNFGSPEECAHWLWLVKYEKEAEEESHDVVESLRASLEEWKADFKELRKEYKALQKTLVHVTDGNIDPEDEKRIRSTKEYLDETD